MNSNTQSKIAWPLFNHRALRVRLSIINSNIINIQYPWAFRWRLDVLAACPACPARPARPRWHIAGNEIPARANTTAVIQHLLSVTLTGNYHLWLRGRVKGTCIRCIYDNSKNKNIVCTELEMCWGDVFISLIYKNVIQRPGLFLTLLKSSFICVFLHKKKGIPTIFLFIFNSRYCYFNTNEYRKTLFVCRSFMYSYHKGDRDVQCRQGSEHVLENTSDHFASSYVVLETSTICYNYR